MWNGVSFGSKEELPKNIDGFNAYFKCEEIMDEATPAATNPVIDIAPPAVSAKAVHRKKKKSSK